MHSVLVADADRGLRRTVAAWIEAYGFSVHEAASAEEALEEMDVSQHAVVLCDASAAGRDGVWLAWRLRERCPNTAIIVATAIRDCETAVSRLRNDVVDYLLKPFGRERLYEALFPCARLACRSRGHAARVARLTLSLADALGVSSHAELVALEHGALLYDIGKLDVPSAILMKSAPLDNREWEVVRCIHSSAMIFEEAAHFLWTGRPRPRASWGVRWDRVSKGVEGGGRFRWERGCWQLPTRMTR